MITLVIRKLYEKSGCKSRNEFYSLNNDISIWCSEKLALANRYDSMVEYRHINFLNNKFYGIARSHLRNANLSLSALINAEIKNPMDDKIKHIILHQYMLDRSYSWDQKNQIVIGNIYRVSNDLILLKKYDESVLWNWFNAYIRVIDFNFTNFFATLETLNDLQNNLTANFLLYVGYFCRYIREGSSGDAERALQYIEKSHTLSSNKNKRTYTQMFYGDVSRLIPAIVHNPKSPDPAEKPCILFDAHIIGDSSRIQGRWLSR